MAVLSSSLRGAAVLVPVLVAGCYTPDLRDCVVACASEADCAPGQVCGSDAFCAAPSVAGTCTPGTTSDAGPSGDVPADAAAPADAFVPPIDAPGFELIVKIGGRGRVVIDGIGQCDHTAPGATCRYGVVPGVELTLTALPVSGTRFDQWKQACSGQAEVCQLTPILLNTSVEAKFKNGGTNDDD